MSQRPQRATEWSADELIPFGKYVLLERLSSGATAAVFRAKTDGEAFERVVALKRVLPQMAGDREFLEAFVREARLAARLSHPNICPIYELGRVGESLYMTMESIEGRDLGKVVAKLRRLGRPMPAVAAAWITARLCDALDYAHGLTDALGKPVGIVHRDLSPANVVLSYDGHVKLVDFGVAAAVGKAQQTNLDSLKRKLGYMSPEMVQGRPVDARSDIFSVGVLLYELITDRRLFEGGDDLKTLGMVSRASVPPPSAITEEAPEALELIVMRALSRNPDDRYPSAGEMGAALTAFVGQEAPMYGPRELSGFLADLFGADIAADRGRTRRLMEASRDPAVLEARRAFFASAMGAVAAAKAQAPDAMVEALPKNATGATAVPRRDPAAGTATAALPWPVEPDTATETFSLLPSSGHAGPDVLAGVTPTRATSRAAERRRPGRPSSGPPSSSPPSPSQPSGAGQRAPASPPGSERAPRPRVAPTPSTVPPPRRAPRSAPGAGPVPPPPAGSVPPRPTVPHGRPAQPPARTSAPGTTWPPGSARGSIPPPVAPSSGSVPPPPLQAHANPGSTSVRPPGPGGDAPAGRGTYADGEGLTTPLGPASGGPSGPGTLPQPMPMALPAPELPESPPPASNRLGNVMLVVGTALLVGAGSFALYRWFVTTAPSSQVRSEGTVSVQYGVVEVRTTPPVAAAVTLDGVAHGQAPLRLTGIPVGRHAVSVAAPGFASAEREIEVTAEAATAVSIELEPTADR